MKRPKPPPPPTQAPAEPVIEKVDRPNKAHFAAMFFDPWMACAVCGKQPPERQGTGQIGSFFPEGSDVLHGYLTCKRCEVIEPAKMVELIEKMRPLLPSMPTEDIVLIGVEADDEPS